MARLTSRSMLVLLSARSNQMRSAATSFNILDTAGRPGRCEITIKCEMVVSAIPIRNRAASPAFEDAVQCGLLTRRRPIDEAGAQWVAQRPTPKPSVLI